MGKSIAIIGAGYLQQPLVAKAREMGLRTVCFAWAEGAVCKDLCDVFYPVSITEKEQILDLCRQEQIDGICTIASDVAAPTVAYVAEQMGLAGNPYQAAVRAHNKHLMREALVEAGVDCPQFRLVDQVWNDQQMVEQIQEMELPLIVKPSDRSGSMAVTKIAHWEQLKPAVEEALQASLVNQALIEEYIEGREISVEFISFQGQHHMLQITDKVTTGAPHFVELAHHQPARLSAGQYMHIEQVTCRALDALGITNGASHSEYKITDTGRVVVMEIGGRMGGDFIGSNLVQLSTGYDFLRGVIEVALGEFHTPQKQFSHHAGVYFLSGETPEILPYIEHADRYPAILQAELTSKDLKPLTCSADRSGYFIYSDPQQRFETLKNKTVMVLGGGRYQLPLIKAARAAGCRVLVMGWPGNFPGYDYATKWYNVDIMDYEQVCHVAAKEHIDAIVGCGSDFILPTIGKVVDRFSLPGSGYQSSVVASDKLLMKQAFARTQVRTAAYAQVTTADEALSQAEQIGYPVVLKIVDGSGSKGVVICQDPNELRQAYSQVQPLTHHSYMVLEQFIQGEEFGAQAYVQNGDLKFCMIHGDLIYHGQSGVPVGHYAPAMTQYPGLQADVEEQLKRAIQALQIDNCAINADFILHDSQVYVLEIGARAGATCLPELVSQCYGIDYYDYLLRGACGLTLPTMSPSQLTPALVFTPYSTQTGKVVGCHMPKLPQIVSCELYPELGDQVNAFRTAYDRIGHLVMRGESIEQLLDLYTNQIEHFPFVELQ